MSSIRAEPDEWVLVLPREAIFPAGAWHGVRDTDAERLLGLVESPAATFLPRARAEQDESWKQVIPYLVLRDGERIFLMRRTRAGGDSRLHDRYSIGVGGHLHPSDGGVMGGLWREWAEELVADFRPDTRRLGVLNDDTQPVGRVHVGLVFEADAQGRGVAVRETEKLSGRFAQLDEVRAVYPSLEGWSQLVFDFIEGRIEAPPASAPGPAAEVAHR